MYNQLGHSTGIVGTCFSIHKHKKEKWTLTFQSNYSWIPKDAFFENFQSFLCVLELNNFWANAENYASFAEVDDGSCTYAAGVSARIQLNGLWQLNGLSPVADISGVLSGDVILGTGYAHPLGYYLTGSPQSGADMPSFSSWESEIITMGITVIVTERPYYYTKLLEISIGDKTITLRLVILCLFKFKFCSQTFVTCSSKVKK